MKTVKSTIGYLAIAIVAVIFSGCEDLYNQLGMSVYSDYQEFEYTLLPAPSGEYLIEETFDAVNTDSISASVDSGFVREVNLSDVTIEIINNDGTLNFDAFESFEAVISSDNMTETVAGMINQVPDNATLLTFDITDDNLLEYMGGEEYVLKIRGVLDKDLETSLDILVRFRFKIGIGL